MGKCIYVLWIYDLIILHFSSMTGLQEAIPFVIICDFFIDFFFGQRMAVKLLGGDYVLDSPPPPQ